MNARGKRTGGGRWAVERERSRIALSRPMAEFRDAVPFAKLVSGVIRALAAAERPWTDSLIDEWNELAGRRFAAHTRPGKLDRSALTVFVENSMWLSELSRYGKRQLLGNLQQRFGRDKIASVILRLDPADSRSGR